MVFINNYTKLKHDFLDLFKKKYVKLISINALYFILLIMVLTFIGSAIYGSVGYLSNHISFLEEFKVVYQATGNISSSQGSSLMDVSETLNKLLITVSLLLSLLLVLYAVLKSTKDVLLFKALFNKKQPKNYFLKSLLVNFLFGLLTFLVLCLLIFLINPYIVLILFLLIFLLMESFVTVKLGKYVYPKKHFFDLWKKHFLVNLIFGILFFIGFIIIVFISNLFVKVSPILGSTIFFILIILAYVKREVLLLLILKYFKS